MYSICTGWPAAKECKCTWRLAWGARAAADTPGLLSHTLSSGVTESSQGAESDLIPTLVAEKLISIEFILNNHKSHDLLGNPSACYILMPVASTEHI